jgi:hypothetical protein
LFKALALSIGEVYLLSSLFGFRLKFSESGFFY